MKILVELDKQDLVSLVRGKEPSYEQMDHPLIRVHGFFSGSYGTWSWNNSLDHLSEEQLWKMYRILKNRTLK